MNVFKITVVGLFFAVLASCTITLSGARLSPRYTGVDPILTPYVDRWFSMAKDRGLKFDKVVTLGFRNIDDGNIVGLCNYGFGFREIDVDKSYWKNSTESDKIVLVDHELVHCYCDRGHDYGDGKEYGDAEKSRSDPSKKDGFWSDGCPISIMFPQIINGTCFINHYQDYMDEMFRGCVPW